MFGPIEHLLTQNSHFQAIPHRAERPPHTRRWEHIEKKKNAARATRLSPLETNIGIKAGRGGGGGRGGGPGWRRMLFQLWHIVGQRS